MAESHVKEKYNQVQANLDRDARHQFENCLSVARIAVGAFQAGEISPDDMDALLNKLKKNERAFGKIVSFDQREYIEQSKVFQEKIPEMSGKYLKDIIKGHRVLFADDECNKLGWDSLLEAILGKGSCYFAEDGDEALKIVSEKEDLDLVYLDLKFPDRAEQGLQILKKIMLRRLDLPVIVFTAEDTSRYVKKCFKYGADDYFAKQFEEEQKNSLDYFLKFKEVTLNSLAKKRQKAVWFKIARLEKAVQEAGPPYYNELFSYLRKAYYYLNLEAESFVYDTLFESGKITHFAEVVIQSGLSLEYTLGRLYDNNRNDKFIKQLRAEKQTTLGNIIAALSAINVLSEKQVEICHKINHLRNEAVHSAQKTRSLTVNEEVALETLTDTINLQKELVCDKLLNIHYKG